LATLDIFEEENLLEKTREHGAFALAKLQSALGSNPHVVDVRGRGLMIGIEFANADEAERVAKYAHASNLLVLRCGTDENIIRLIPPLVISEADLGHGLEILIAGASQD
jgi:4-aminobutyrate aminotransferase-like enzyme